MNGGVKLATVMTHGRPSQTAAALETLRLAAVDAGFVLRFDREEVGKHGLAKAPGLDLDAPLSDDVDLCVADALGDFAVEIVAAARRAGFRIADMAVHDGGAGFRGLDRGFGDLLGRAWNVRGFAGGIAGAGDGAGDEDVTVHGKRHCRSPGILVADITSQEKAQCFHFSDPSLTIREMKKHAGHMLDPSADTLDIDILVLPETNLILVASVIEPLRAANRISGQALYRWRIFSPDGLPVGVQIVGPYLEDATPIDLAGRLADVVGGFRPPPGY